MWNNPFKRDWATQEPVQEKKANEALKGDQHKIDANDNGRIDAHDFKVLRNKTKKKSDEKNEVEMNPKLKDSKNVEAEAKESKIRSALKSVLERKDNHSPNQDKAEKAGDNIKGQGAKDMMAAADAEIAKGPDAHLNEPEIDKENFKKMTSNVPSKKMRNNDNPKGDTKIVAAGTQFKDPAAMKAESFDKLSGLKAAYASMYAPKVEEEEEIEESYTHEVDYAEDGAHTAKKFVATAKKAGIKAKIHDPSGPGGGHPVVHLGHKDEDHVHKFLKKHYNPDMDKDEVKASRL